MTCSLCHAKDHTFRRCPKRPGATVRMDVPGEAAEVVMRDVLRPIITACMHAPNIVEAIALSAYLQGALDGGRPDVAAATAALCVALPETGDHVA